jgi:hypothetical protein
MPHRFTILLALMSLAAGTAHAGPYTMSRYLVTSGGTTPGGGGYALRGGVGQPLIAPSTGGGHQLQSGFFALPGALSTGVDEHPAAPAATRLLHSAPNPFQSRTEIAFELAAAQPATLEIFDVTGARVRTLASGRFEAGRHQVAWDGRRDGGGLAPAGVYWLRFESGTQQAQRRLVRLP